MKISAQPQLHPFVICPFDSGHSSSTIKIWGTWGTMIRDECTKTVNRTEFTQTKTTKNRRKAEEKGTNGKVCKRKTAQGYKWERYKRKKVQGYKSTRHKCKRVQGKQVQGCKVEMGTRDNRYKGKSGMGKSGKRKEEKSTRENRYKGIKWKRYQTKRVQAEKCTRGKGYKQKKVQEEKHASVISTLPAVHI